MTRTPLLLTLAVAAALAGCSKEGHTIVAGDTPDDGAANAAAPAKVQLPPAIVASKTYRCDDNHVVSVDFLSDGKSANVHPDKGAASVLVTAPEAGKPMVGSDGYSVEGSATDATAKIAVPGHPSQSCKAA